MIDHTAENDALREAAAEALEEAADERGELWSGPPGTSVCYDCAEKVGTWLHGRAADARARVIPPGSDSTP